MRGFKFLHCGDIHLDARLRNTGLVKKGSEIRRAEIKDTFTKIIDIAGEKNLDALFICGDLFEHEYVSKNTLNYLISEFKRIKNVKIFITPGNHDPYSKNSFYSILQWPQNVYIFHDNQNRIYLEDKDISIYGLGFNQKYLYESLVPTVKEQVLKEKASTKKILLTHGTINGVIKECEYHPIILNDIIEMGFDYVAVGHYHKHRFIGDNIAYCGSPEPLGFDETGEHGIIIGEIHENYVEADFIPIGKRRFVIEKLDCSNISTLEQIDSMISSIAKNNKENFLKIILKGQLHEEINIDTELLKCKYENICFILTIEDKTQKTYDIEQIKKEKNLRGIFLSKMISSIDNETDEDLKRKLKKAMLLGLNALND